MTGLAASLLARGEALTRDFAIDERNMAAVVVVRVREKAFSAACLPRDCVGRGCSGNDPPIAPRGVSRDKNLDNPHFPIWRVGGYCDCFTWRLNASHMRPAFGLLLVSLL